MQAKQDREPELIPNEDQEQINLEHILPENPAAEWGVDDETAAACYKRLGNMVLLQATPNSTIGNLQFSERKRFWASLAISSRQWLQKNALGD